MISTVLILIFLYEFHPNDGSSLFYAILHSNEPAFYSSVIVISYISNIISDYSSLFVVKWLIGNARTKVLFTLLISSLFGFLFIIVILLLLLFLRNFIIGIYGEHRMITLDELLMLIKMNWDHPEGRGMIFSIAVYA